MILKAPLRARVGGRGGATEFTWLALTRCPRSSKSEDKESTGGAAEGRNLTLLLHAVTNKSES